MVSRTRRPTRVSDSLGIVNLLCCPVPSKVLVPRTVRLLFPMVIQGTIPLVTQVTV